MKFERVPLLAQRVTSALTSRQWLSRARSWLQQANDARLRPILGTILAKLADIGHTIQKLRSWLLSRLRSTRDWVSARKRSLISLLIALIILALGYVMPWYLLPNYTLGPSIALSTYSALLQAFAALFTIVGMFLIFRVERLDTEIAAANSILRSRLTMVIYASSLGELPAELRPAQIDPRAVLLKVTNAIARKVRNEEPPYSPTEPKRYDHFEQKNLVTHAHELMADSLRLISLRERREIILNRAKWPLSLVAITAIVAVVLVPTSESIHAYPRNELMLVIILSLLAVWAFTEVFLFTMQTLYKPAVSEEEIYKRVNNLMKVAADEIRPCKNEETPPLGKKGKAGPNVKSTD